MRIFENDCVGCPDGMGCMGNSCPYIKVPHYYCDDCEEEAELYYFDDQELCIHCIIERLERVEGSFLD